jgi:putative PIN family toxin of toxin-antitoxin system
VRSVLDPNILIAALLSPSGAPAQIVARWFAGEFELIVSEALIAELERALSYPKLRARVTADEAAEFKGTILVPQPPMSTHRSPDRGDDYLLALAENTHAVLVSGDQHLLTLPGSLPIQSARAFLDALDAENEG